MQADDPQGEVALLLCESLLHVLVEEGLIPKERALEALEGIAEVAEEMHARGRRSARSQPASEAAMLLIQRIADSFAAKSEIRAGAAGLPGKG